MKTLIEFSIERASKPVSYLKLLAENIIRLITVFMITFFQIYFRATRIGSPGERHLYTVTDFKSGQPGIVACIR
jgi:hypothetical protein